MYFENLAFDASYIEQRNLLKRRREAEVLTGSQASARKQGEGTCQAASTSTAPCCAPAAC